MPIFKIDTTAMIEQRASKSRGPHEALAYRKNWVNVPDLIANVLMENSRDTKADDGFIRALGCWSDKSAPAVSFTLFHALNKKNYHRIIEELTNNERGVFRGASYDLSFHMQQHTERNIIEIVVQGDFYLSNNRVLAFPALPGAEKPAFVSLRNDEIVTVFRAPETMEGILDELKNNNLPHTIKDGSAVLPCSCYVNCAPGPLMVEPGAIYAFHQSSYPLAKEVAKCLVAPAPGI